MRAFSRDIDQVIKDSIVIGCAFSQSGKVSICALDSILRPEYTIVSIGDTSILIVLTEMIYRSNRAAQLCKTSARAYYSGQTFLGVLYSYIFINLIWLKMLFSFLYFFSNSVKGYSLKRLQFY